jgi:hypothetical protein
MLIMKHKKLVQSVMPFALSVLIAGQSHFASAAETRAPIEGGDAPTGALTQKEPTDFPQGPLFPYSLLDSALAGNIDENGNVYYANLKENKPLGWFLKAVATADLKQFPTFNVYETDPATGRETIVKKDRTSELVFWINAYNAHILHAIALAYPVKSIDDIKGFDTAEKYNVAGKNYSFKQMRDKILSFGDARALFALITGTAGGFLPSPTAVRYVEYDARMDSAVEVFINDPRNVAVNRIGNTVTVSSQLKEISSAFTKDTNRQKYEGVRTVLSAYATNKGYYNAGVYRIEFKDADRSLNVKSARGDNSQ